MKLKLGLQDALWVAAGVALLAGATFALWRFRTDEGSTELLARKARKVDLVEEMSLELASACEAEKSAVMAATAQDSERYAEQARAAIARVEEARTELSDLLDAAGRAEQTSPLEDFSKVFDEFQSLDREILALAVEHTNTRASALAFGPASAVLDEMRAALASAAEKTAQIDPGAALLACSAEAAALHVSTLLAPHIAEADDERMKELEARMDADDAEVRSSLESLAARAGEAAGDVQAAASAYDRFSEVRAEILRLSRANTDVRSFALSLNQKRKVMVLCDDALDAMKRAILEERIPGVDYGATNPRRLRALPEAGE